MITLARIELDKLRTTRVGWIVLAAAVLIVVAGVSGLVLSGGKLADPDVVTKAFGHVGLVSLCSLVLGVFAVAGEYRYRTITDTYLSTPRRDRVLATKLLVYLAAGLAVGVAAAVAALVAVKIWWAAKGVPVDLGTRDVWLTLLGGVAWNAAFAIIGVALGAVLRNLAVAVAVALAWIALVEGIVGQLLGSGLARWLPFTAGQALGRVDIGAAGHLPQWGAGVVLVAYAAVISAAAASITLRRDVT